MDRMPTGKGGAPSSPAHPLPWHSLPLEQVFEKLETRPAGLGDEEVGERLRGYGPNALPAPQAPGIALLFLHQFLSPLIYILLLAAVISLVIGEFTDAAFILAVILLNAVLGAVQEWKAERSAAALKQLLSVRARVRRGGHERTVPAAELVPGDIVLLESGGKVPADLRLASCHQLRIDESLLTGESVAVAKRAVAVDAEHALAERHGMAFAGSTVMTGRGTGVVVATGLHTEVGQIARAVTSSEAEKPPLVVRMERFARQISLAVSVIVLLLGLVALARGASLSEVFFMAVALAVSAIPEGLPVAITVALSIATARMARRNVIVRRLPAVEALGSCTCIASDKTGTLTVNRQTAKVVLLPGETRVTLTGEGYNDEGGAEYAEGGGLSAVDAERLRRLGEAAAICNEGTLRRVPGGWHADGDAVDLALLALGYKLSLDPVALKADCTVLDHLPFESESRYAATLYRRGEETALAVKGAVEVVLPFCRSARGPAGAEPLELHACLEQAHILAEWGFRVIALAEQRHLEDSPALPLERDGVALTLLGLVGLIDPLRPEATAAVARCRQAGVRVLMVTGDHPATALTLAMELGIAAGREELVTGAELEAAGGPEVPQFLDVVRRARVFSRVTPLQKQQIVEGLGLLGHFVAVTGDGVNDAPALRRAHIGVAMGSGTDIAKETAALLVTDDNFASIEAGIEEGRVAYANIRKVIYLLISCGAAEILLFVLALAAGLPLPLAAVQLLWLNLVTNGIQDVALAFEKGEPGVLELPPRRPDEGVFDRLMIAQTVVSGAVMGMLAFLAWWWLLAEGMATELARNRLLLLMVLFEGVQVFNCRSERTSAFRVPLSRNWLLIGGVVLALGVHLGAMQIPVMQRVLQVAPLAWQEWLACLALALVLLAVMELFKQFWKREGRGESSEPEACSR